MEILSSPKTLDTSIAMMSSVASIQKAASKADFSIVQQVPYFVQSDLKDLFLYSGKHHPELYFINDIREGISSFAFTSYAGEVEQGLRLEQHDLVTKKFYRVKQPFEIDLDDYLLLVLQKQ